MSELVKTIKSNSKNNKNSFQRFYDINGWGFVLPAVILVSLFMIYPIVNSLWMAMHSGRGVIMEFVGFGNVTRLFNDPVFFKSTFKYIYFLNYSSAYYDFAFVSIIVLFKFAES